MDIFVEGYWRSNLGDDLMLRCMAEQFGKCSINIICESKYYKTLAQIDNVIAIKYKRNILNRLADYITEKFDQIPPLPFSNIKKKNNLFKKYRYFIELGGSIFMQSKDGTLGRTYLERTKRASIKGQKYYVIGSNFGPVYSPKQIDAYRLFFNKVTYTSFRDRESNDYFKELGNVNYFPDVVLGLDTSKYSKKIGNYIVISVINSKRFPEDIAERYEAMIVNTTNGFISEGTNVLLMSFCEAEGDFEEVERIYSKYYKNDSLVRMYNYDSMDKALEIISNSKGIVATRYHAMILGWVFGKPTAVVSYNQKIKNAIMTFNPQQKYYELSSLPTKLEKRDFSVIEYELIETLKSSAKNQFAELKKDIN